MNLFFFLRHFGLPFLDFRSISPLPPLDLVSILTSYLRPVPLCPPPSTSKDRPILCPLTPRVHYQWSQWRPSLRADVMAPVVGLLLPAATSYYGIVYCDCLFGLATRMRHGRAVAGTQSLAQASPHSHQSPAQRRAIFW